MASEDRRMESATIQQEGGKNGYRVSRRSFLRGAAAVGASLALLPTVTRSTHAAPYKFFATDLPDEKLIDMQRKMLQIRWYDRTVADRMQTERGFRGYGHFYCGQEAVAVGVCAALNNDDWIQSNHRSHGHAIAKGSDLKKMAAEITFKATGTNKGYGGSMHIVQTEVGELGADGVVGPGAVIAAGAAWGLRARGKGQVAVCFGGDGQQPSPYFHIALNEAALHNLPFIYVIENNQYQIQYHYSNSTKLIDIADAANGYHIPGVVVDGQDVLGVYQAAKTAVDRARAGEGPTLIEAKTYRYYDHFGAAGVAPGQLGAFGLGYRSDKEVRHWLSRDPVDLFAASLIQWGVLTEASAHALEEEVKAEVEEAFRFADQSPVPNPEDAVKNVFVEGTVPPRQLANCPLY